jgi:hypothetical protein
MFTSYGAHQALTQKIEKERLLLLLLLFMQGRNVLALPSLRCIICVTRS